MKFLLQHQLDPKGFNHKTAASWEHHLLMNVSQRAWVCHSLVFRFVTDVIAACSDAVLECCIVNDV